MYIWIYHTYMYICVFFVALHTCSSVSMVIKWWYQNMYYVQLKKKQIYFAYESKPMYMHLHKIHIPEYCWRESLDKWNIRICSLNIDMCTYSHMVTVLEPRYNGGYVGKYTPVLLRGLALAITSSTWMPRIYVWIHYCRCCWWHLPIPWKAITRRTYMNTCSHGVMWRYFCKHLRNKR